MAFFPTATDLSGCTRGSSFSYWRICLQRFNNLEHIRLAYEPWHPRVHLWVHRRSYCSHSLFLHTYDSGTLMGSVCNWTAVQYLNMRHVCFMKDSSDSFTMVTISQLSGQKAAARQGFISLLPALYLYQLPRRRMIQFIAAKMVIPAMAFANFMSQDMNSPARLDLYNSTSCHTSFLCVFLSVTVMLVLLIGCPSLDTHDISVSCKLGL